MQMTAQTVKYSTKVKYINWHYLPNIVLEYFTSQEGACLRQSKQSDYYIVHKKDKGSNKAKA